MNKLLSLLVVFLICMIISPVIAETHSLHERGNTLIEAEDYSAISPEYPYTEPCKKCSNQHNLGYYWSNSWFDIEVDVPRSGDYGVSLRVASGEGTEIEVLAVESESAALTRVGLIEVPKTGD